MKLFIKIKEKIREAKEWREIKNKDLFSHLVMRGIYPTDYSRKGQRNGRLNRDQ